MSAPPAVSRRVAVRVEGVVQGVGFRPFVFRIAEGHGLAGYVLNDAAGVLLEAEGEPAAVAAFLGELVGQAPPLAHVEHVHVEERDPTGGAGFAIVASPSGGDPRVPIAPDTATCEDCLHELRDPADRRYRYPFINCTNCGPRFTIVRGVPYDRALTTMSAFTMCAACQAEYDDPRDRRFHAQPNACPACGPRARLVGAASGAGCVLRTPEPGLRRTHPDGDVVAAAAALLREGRIVAVKGLGGYHLACRADDETAVSQLRARKHREDRPFALMVADVASARTLVELGDEEEAQLVSRARPIVLARRRADARIAPSVAPRAAELGVMLPYTPLHELLVADVAGVPLVMTSGNVADEPIAYGDDDALEHLGGIADAFLVHDRPIHMRTDDGVVRVVMTNSPAPLMIRRSRGNVPDALELPVPAARDILACGAELKSTFCLARRDRAWVGHHLGDLRNAEVLRSFVEGVAHFEHLFDVRPEVVAHDLHPDYLSTAYALERDGVELVGVQHHHAHLAAVLAEHGVADARAVGAIYDGSGHGTDGTVWGGEILTGDLREFTRVGSLFPVRLPGGDRAVREPWRMACAWLVAAFGEDVAMPAAFRDAVDRTRWEQVRGLAISGFSAPVTTSMGRLFDAVGALCGLRTHATYEGQAAIELEAACDRSGPDPLVSYDSGVRSRGVAYDLPVGADGVLDARPTVRAVVDDLGAGVAVPVVAARFHGAVARATSEACAVAASTAGVDRVVLSGGVFLNRVLLEDTAARLAALGLRVLIPRALPPGDGAISFGQAAVAAALR